MGMTYIGLRVKFYIFACLWQQAEQTVHRCSAWFSLKDLYFMCEHEFNLAVLMPVKPRRRRSPCTCSSNNSAFSSTRVRRSQATRICPNPILTLTNNTQWCAVIFAWCRCWRYSRAPVRDLEASFIFTRRERNITYSTDVWWIWNANFCSAEKNWLKWNSAKMKVVNSVHVNVS